MQTLSAASRARQKQPGSEFPWPAIIKTICPLSVLNHARDLSRRGGMTSESEKTIPAGRRVPILQILGPGLITGASDDDPSGIATYSQAGAQFGYRLCWTLLLTFPLMAGIQEISARIGRVTGVGIAGNIRRYYP